jgi:hypothetical protein
MPRTSASILAAALSMMITCVVQAAASASPAKPEIDALLARVGDSGCAFNRNGTWYPAAQAKAHLLQKLRYLENRGLVQSTEQFIDRAASRSSETGQPYWVKCADAAPVQSRVWLSAQLHDVRARHQARSTP